MDFKASRFVAAVRSQIASQLGHGLSALIQSRTVAVQGINLYTGPAEDASQMVPYWSQMVTPRMRERTKLAISGS